MRYLMITLSLLTFLGCAQGKVRAESFAIENLGDGIYVHHGLHLDIDDGYHGDICNASFIVGSKGVAVIDTGGSFKIGVQLREAIRKVTPLPVLYVINTHVHPDHIYGNAAFLPSKPNELKPEFVGHEKLANTMELRKEQYAKLNAKLLGDDAKASELVKPTMSVKINQVESTHLDIGGRTLTLTAHPVAHTNTDLSVMDSKTNTLFTGDLLFIERTPVLEGDIKGFLNVIEQLKMSHASQVVPGHGYATKDWLTALSNEQRYLNMLL
ncbi:MAG: hypothetical protein RLZZ379_304, partial [Pseudomonadota bacterium]